MDEPHFRMPLYLPAGGAAETEATIIEWHVSEGDRFRKGQVLAQVDSAKSVFDFESPCDGMVIRLLHLEGETVALSEPIMEIETSDPEMKDWIPPAASSEEPIVQEAPAAVVKTGEKERQTIALLGVGGYTSTR